MKLLPELVHYLAASVIRDSSFEPRERWPEAVVVLSAGARPRIAARDDFAPALTARGFEGAAGQCLGFVIPDGSVLVWIEAPEIEPPHFVVLHLDDGGLRAMKEIN